MAPEEKTEFTLLVGSMLASFGREITKESLGFYWLGLSDLDLPALKSALARVARECEHCPPPVIIRRMAGEKNPESRAMAAWDDALKAVSDLGPYKHVNFNDRFINATIRNLGGWPTFIGRFTDAETEKWLRLEFIKAYQSFASSRIDGEICEPLAGLSEVQFITQRIGEDVKDALGAPHPFIVQCATPTESQKRISEQPRRRLPRVGLNSIGELI